MSKPVSSKHLEGISDLTLTAPVKQGFIDAFDAVTYETRLRLLLDALFKVRSTAREYSTIKPFVDTTERIQSLLDFRLAIVDIGSRPQLFLSATFDRPFEPYMRLIWNPLGSLLDVIFCNCEDYVTATEHGFPEYLAWVRSAQVDTDFFYAATGHSVNDVQYLTQIERLQREAAAGACDAAAAAATVVDLEQQAAAVRNHPDSSIRNESNEMAMEAVVALYRLADFYPADRMEGDGKYLLRATQHLLAGWNSKELPSAVREVYAEQLRWFERPLDAPPAPAAPPDAVPVDFQPGILRSAEPRPPVTHGCLLLMRLTDPAPGGPMARERAFIRAIGNRVWEEGDISCNLAFTRNGLVNFGVPQTEMNRFPQEFLEGMENRAGLLGDVRWSHPRRWNLPRRNWPAPPRPMPDSPADTPVEMSEIDFVIHLRTHSPYSGHQLPGDENHPLYDAVSEIGLAAKEAGIELLAVESMRRASSDPLSKKDHFGFADGLSQPALAHEMPEARRDEVRLGELVCGYVNDRDDAPPDPPSVYLKDSTFLVLRKLRQHVGALERFLDEQGARFPDLPREDLLAKMMGRYRSGAPLLPGTTTQSNDFDYENDKAGLHCPFQSHVRRTNPRIRAHGRPTPRILRRGLSYGPPYATNPAAERGVFFMAYNASIAEQFEVIQSWVNGGNSTGIASCQGDPLMGVAQDDAPRTFRFHHGGKLFRVAIPKPFVSLEWGMYLLVPSWPAIEAIVAEPAAPARGELSAEAEQGKGIVDGLLELAGREPDGRARAAARWKTYLEDFSAKDPAERNQAASIWAAIRECHGGALRVPYTDHANVPPARTDDMPPEAPGDGAPPVPAGVSDVILVASEALVDHVFRDPGGVYSMKGQNERMEASFGSIFLGLDRSDAEYALQAEAVNREIFAIGEEEAFGVARRAADLHLDALLGGFLRATKKKEGKIELRRDFITPVLAEVCRHWFGVPDEPPTPVGAPKPDPATYHVAKGGWSWDPAPRRKPRCPGDYMAPSRYCFYPDPMPAVRKYGQEQGQGLQARLEEYFGAMIDAAEEPEARLSKAIFNAAPFKDKPDRIASTVVGVMTGFLPPADGSLRLALYDWIKEKTLWRLQHDLASDPERDSFARAVNSLRQPLMKAMQKRPSPDLLWRTATGKDMLGGEKVVAGDRVVIGIVSATAEQMAADRTDVYPIFGGERHEPPAPEDPTHACPAYKAAMGTMLGMLSALLEKGRIEEMPSPLIVRFSDPRPLPPA